MRFALLLCALTACAHPVMHATDGVNPQPREADCRFKVVATHPGPGFEEVGVITIQGDRSFGAGVYTDPKEFADAVRAEVCRGGGDVLATEVSGHGVIARGIVFRAVAVAAPPAPVAETPPPDGCSPICSPGFLCTAGTCVAQCNPACEAGEVCGRDRLCHSGG